jgi:hypothetical protein
MQRDLVLRWLEQLRALVARILRGERGADVELLDHQIDDAVGQLLGAGSALIERLEPEAAAGLLADPIRIYGYAQLVALRSAVLRARGHSAQARSARLRATRLAKEAVSRTAVVPPDWEEWVAALEDDAAREVE